MSETSTSPSAASSATTAPASPGIDKRTLRELSRLRPGRGLLGVVVEWAGIAAAIALAERFPHPLSYLAAIVWIGARQHGLGILLHEATHYRLAKSRRVNDWLSDLLVAWPLFLRTDAYRQIHLQHHRHTNNDLDPDWIGKQTAEWRFPMSPRRLFRLLLLDLSGLRAPQLLREIVLPLNGPGRDARPASARIARLAYYLAIATPIVATGHVAEFVLYWLVPYFTWLKAILRVRAIAEHFGVPNTQPLDMTRTTYPRLWERLLIAPKNVHFHLDHHLYPGVPYYNLPALHRALLQDPAFRAQAALTRSYLGVLRECTGQTQAAS